MELCVETHALDKTKAVKWGSKVLKFQVLKVALRSVC